MAVIYALIPLTLWLFITFRSLVVRAEDIKSGLPNFPESHLLILDSIFSHLEDKRGWLADRFDALEDSQLAECSVNLTLVLLSVSHYLLVII